MKKYLPDQGVVTYRNKAGKNWSKNDSGLDGVFPKIGLFKTHDELHDEKEK